MSLKVRPYVLGQDYPELVEWWRRRNWPAVPCEKLPLNGVVAEDERHKYAAVFFYVIEGGWAWLDWLVTNPDAPLRARPEAIESVLATAKSTILAMKAAVGEFDVSIITLLNNENLIGLHGRLGFRNAEKGMTTMIWRSE